MKLFTSDHIGKEDLEIIQDSVSIQIDLAGMILGRKIGDGTSRAVYEYAPDPTNKVVKIERGDTKQNVAEQLVWETIEEFEVKEAYKWFARVYRVSGNGRILVMERTYPMNQKIRPKKVPDYFTDIKWDNWGWIGDRFVCHDYGFLTRILDFRNKKRKVDWYS